MFSNWVLRSTTRKCNVKSRHSRNKQMLMFHMSLLKQTPDKNLKGWQHKINSESPFRAYLGNAMIRRTFLFYKKVSLFLHLCDLSLVL